jgi:hypothetical protein
MLAWTPKFPKAALPLAYWRLLKARHQYFDRVGLTIGPWGMPRFTHRRGSQQRLALMRDKQKDRRCFIIANGPSLQQTDMPKLRRELTMGCNGIYSAFPEWGFHTSYLVYEDIEQLELRRHDVGRVKGPIKMAALYNAYAFKADSQTVFFNAPRMRGQRYYWEELYPQFSTDFASVVHLGSTVTYIMLQLAYHLGCNPVYLIGLDHDYGELPKRFKPGKITITEDNIDLIRGLHFSSKYYQVGDQIGVPDVARQEAAYTKAREAFEADGRQVFNASAHTALDVFERCDFDGLFDA